MRSVEPLNVEAAAADKRVHLLHSRTQYTIGSYLGVPMTLGAAELYGTLCVVDPDAHRFGNQDLDMLTIVAAWLSWYLERDQLKPAFAHTPMHEA